MKSLLFSVALSLSAVLSAAQEEPGVRLSPEDSEAVIIDKAVRVRPSPSQLRWQQDEFACFIHFGVNTFTDREWGEGSENPAVFNPTELNPAQWVETCKAAGMRRLVLTAKHHDGFCLWPSAYTEHSVKSSPWKNGQGDLVREVSDACRAGGIRFGIYLSPWDRHEPSYGDSPAYNQFFLNQLRELLTGYGEIAEVWFDGACGEGPNGKRQVYDWDAYYALVRELQPGACISICGPDVRWCGNEAGHTRESEWSVLPSGVNAQDEDLGSRAVLREAAQRSAELRWRPAQVDTSIRPGWFYHPGEDGKVKSLEHLLNVYYGSVGGNAELLLNVPPDRRGRIHENDVRRLKDLGEVLRSTFDENLAEGAARTVSEDGCTIEWDLGAAKTFNRILLQEDLAQGQRIERFSIEAWDGAAWTEVVQGTVVGHKRLVQM